ncbi:MAG: ATPase [Clostridiales bacterium]|nr:ATPase [Clostridiales bacterium]
MKLVSIIGPMDRLDQTVRVCGDTGVAQPDEAMTFFSSTYGFQSVREENPFADPLGRLRSAVARLDGALEDGGGDDDRPNDELFTYVDGFAAAAEKLTQRRSELSARYEAVGRDIEQFQHFIGLDIDLDKVLACENIKVRFGRLPNESLERLNLYDENPFVLFFSGVQEEDYCWGVYFAPLGVATEIDRIFSSLYFERQRIPAAVGRPEDVVADLRREREQVRKELDRCRREITECWQRERENCQAAYYCLKTRSYYFEVRRYAARYNDKFVLACWIPAREEKRFCESLDQLDAIEYSVEKPDKDHHHTPPVELRNPRLFRPFEYLVGMYGTPRYNELDPTIFVAITYTLLFGFMFGDLGQGLCLALAGGLMWRLKRMDIGRILIPCGLSAAVFGVVFGSVFGFEHVLDPLYRSLLGLPEKPVEVMGAGTPIRIILAAVLIGISLILVSMLLNMYSCLRRRDYENALFSPNGVAGFLFFGSLACGAVAQLMFGLPVFSLPYVLLLEILPLLLILFKEPLGGLVEHRPDWKPESWGGYLLQNFFELFEGLLSYLSNTMSFLRVAAFVLIHAGMMMAVFTLANLFQTVGYTVTVILGNALVMAMEALLVAIQVMRLEFYEMFSRYYNGDGRPFKPLAPSAAER